MRNRIHSFFIATACLVSLHGLTQEWKGLGKDAFAKVIQPISQVSRAENQKVYFDRFFFEEMTKGTPDSKESGMFYRGIKNQYRTENNAVTTIQSNDIKVTIDTVQKVILIAKSDSLFNQADFSQNIEKMMNQIDTIYQTSNGKVNKYQLLFNDFSTNFSGIEIHVADKTFQLLEVSIFYRPSNYFSESMDDETIEQPKIVMKYSGYEQISGKNQFFTWSKWLIDDKKGRFQIKPEYAHYELIDTRVEI